MTNQQQIALLLALSFCLCEGSIRCYTCSSTNDQRCGNDFGLTSPAAKDCPGTCIKRTGERDNAGVKVDEVTRGCVLQADDGCKDNQNYNGITVYACTCNTNYCNSGTSKMISPLTFLLVAVACIHHLCR